MQTTTTTTRKRPASSASSAVTRSKRSRYTRRPYYPKATTEWKYLDTVFNQDMNTTPVLQLLNGLTLGNTASTRIGQKYNIVTVEAQFRALTTAATGVEQFCRYLFVLDRQPNGVAPAAITDILSSNSPTALRNLENRKRFKIILSRTFAMGATSVATGTETSRTFHDYVKFKRPITVDCNSQNNGDIRDIVTNSLYICVLGNMGAGNTDANLIGTIRVRYTDM